MSKKKACIYRRVADSSNDEAMELQRIQTVEYAKNEGFEIVHEIEEYGSGSTLERPGITELRSRAANKEFDVLVIRDISRLTRDMATVIEPINELNSFGVEIRSMDGEVKLSQEYIDILNRLSE